MPSCIEGKKITSKPHHENRRAFKAPRKEFFVAPLLRRRRKRRKRVFLGVLFNPFLSETRFSRRSRGERNHHHHSKVCVLLCFENSKRNETFFAKKKRNTTLLCCCCCRASSSSKKERVIGERERESGRSALRFETVFFDRVFGLIARGEREMSSNNNDDPFGE